MLCALVAVSKELLCFTNSMGAEDKTAGRGRRARSRLDSGDRIVSRRTKRAVKEEDGERKRKRGLFYRNEMETRMINLIVRGGVAWVGVSGPA